MPYFEELILVPYFEGDGCGWGRGGVHDALRVLVIRTVDPVYSVGV